MTDADFRDAYRAHKDVLFRFARRMTGSDSAAEDVVQESFMALWRRPAAYDESRGTLRSFLLGVARNQALERLRRNRPHEELSEDASVVAPLDIEGRQRAELVARAVSALPALQREALILAEYEDLSLDEISKVTGAEIAAVKSRLHRGRDNLRHMLAPLLQTKGTVHGTTG